MQRVIVAVAKWLWKWAGRFFTARDLLDLFGWKTFFSTAGATAVTVLWSYLSDWPGPIIFVLALSTVAAAMTISAAIEVKRSIRADEVIANAEAEGVAESRRQRAIVVDEKRADLLERRSALKRLLDEAPSVKPHAELARSAPAPGNESAYKRWKHEADHVANWAARVRVETNRLSQLETAHFMNTKEQNIAAEFDNLVARLEEIIARIELKISDLPVYPFRENTGSIPRSATS